AHGRRAAPAGYKLACIPKADLPGPVYGVGPEPPRLPRTAHGGTGSRRASAGSRRLPYVVRRGKASRRLFARDHRASGDNAGGLIQSQEKSANRAKSGCACLTWVTFTRRRGGVGTWVGTRSRPTV